MSGVTRKGGCLGVLGWRSWGVRRGVQSGVTGKGGSEKKGWGSRRVESEGQECYRSGVTR